MFELEFATKEHKGQKRKDGKDYITHPIAVADIALGIAKKAWKGWMKEYPSHDIDFLIDIFDEECLDALEHKFYEAIYAVAILHDTIEDTKRDKDKVRGEIRHHFGDVVLEEVEYLTKSEGDTYYHRIKLIKGSIIAKIVKTADLLHNLSDLKEGSLKDKYRFAYNKLTGEDYD